MRRYYLVMIRVNLKSYEYIVINLFILNEWLFLMTMDFKAILFVARGQIAP